MVAKQKILIVDDDNNIAELISLYLTKECYETMIVNDGEEALKVFDTFKPQLILLDLMLPGIDGYQVCREIRARSNTPIIMLSAKGEVFDKVLGLELGADDYIIKPFDSKELVARVNDHDTTGFCEPVVDITPDFRATACFGSYDPVDCGKFRDLIELERYLLLKKSYPRVCANATGKCAGCPEHECLRCQGGCLGFAEV